MKQFFILAFSFSTLTAPVCAQWLAQNYTAANPLLDNEIHSSERQAWQKEEDLVNGHIPGNTLMRMKAVTETIVGFFQDSIITEGTFSPAWHGEYFTDAHNSGKDMKFSIQCNFNDQKANLTILANNIRPLLMESLVVNNQEFLAIRPATGGDKDHPYFEYTSNGTDKDGGDGTGTTEEGGALRFRSWLVATGGQLPYTPVSRAEYLAAARMELVGMKNIIIAGLKKDLPLRNASVQEADKRMALDQLTTLYSGMELQLRTRMFLNSYKTDEEYQKEMIDKGTAALDSTIALMDYLRSHLSAAALAKPAIVSVQAAAFDGFEDGHGGRMLVRINPAFEGSTGNADAPRCLLVQLEYDPSEPMAAGIDRQLQERFDGEKLKSIL
jgi:hypothetical protein